MRTVGKMADVQGKTDASLASDFVSSAFTPAVVDVVWSGAAERFMRPPFIVPATIESEFSQHVASAERDEDATGALRFDRSDAALDDGNASVAPDGSVARLDATFLAPSTVVCAIELCASVRDDVLGSRVGIVDEPTEKPADLQGRRRTRKDGHTHNAA
jgi:hypothetical protein